MKEFRLYHGLSPYWHRAKEVDDLTAKYFKLYSDLYRRTLFTYYNVKDFLNWKSFISYRADTVDLMLDSGAFSVWKMGLEDFVVEKYIEFCLEQQEEHLFKSFIFIGLDKIPGTLNRAASNTEVEEAVKISFINYKKMIKAGIKNVVPVYHLGEPESVLKTILDGFEYMGLGGLARGASHRARRDFLEASFGIIQKRNPDINVHGFGITAEKLVWEYPWYSVDSVIMQMGTGYGRVFVFTDNRMKTKYVSGIKKDEQVYPSEKKYLSEYFGIEFEKLLNLWCRKYYSLREFNRFEDFINEQRKPKKHYQQTLNLEDL